MNEDDKRAMRTVIDLIECDLDEMIEANGYHSMLSAEDEAWRIRGVEAMRFLKELYSRLEEEG